ncbi:MAG: xanthine dehydrogenase family protein molybdopterin-binding subunit [Gemmatimonadales bacterium]
MTTSFSRREFIGAGGLALAVTALPVRRLAAVPFGASAARALAPSAFVEITSDGVVSVWVTKSDMGQGVRTALPMILADELDADWSKVQVVQADAHPRYGEMGTGGSSSVASLWDPLRKAGAQAREMLIGAAAERWSVAPSECQARNGIVEHPATGRRFGFGDLVNRAALLPVPENPKLKEPSEFRLIGTDVPGVDTRDKVTGKAGYGIDVVVPGMRYAVIARCPVFGGTMQGHDPARALAVPGVLAVIEVPSGAAVIATGTWAAMEGRKALECRWDEGPAAQLDSNTISRQLHGRALMAGALARNDGDALGIIATSRTSLDATYEVPLLAHATMEPMNCVADVRPDRCEIWAPHQAPDWAQRDVAGALGLDREQVTVHTTLLGGGFGRRFLSYELVEAAQVSRAAGMPIKLMFTREDDMQRDWYRPMSVHRMAGAVDPQGQVSGWLHRVVTPSIGDQLWPGSVKNQLDLDAVDGAVDLHYAIPNLRVEYGMISTPVPIGWWRSVYASQTCFANECFLDELAAAAGRDPLVVRQELLAHSPRHLAVLNLAAQKAGWGKAPAGRAQGIAIHHFFSDAIVAEVAEVSIEAGKVRVHKVTCAVDCGLAINPANVRYQIEGGVIYGLSAALYGEITIEKGRVKQSNFHDYPVLRMPDAPVVEVHIVPSAESPKGVGEPGLPPIAPAVANAVARLTGTRVRKLPIEV